MGNYYDKKTTITVSGYQYLFQEDIVAGMVNGGTDWGGEGQFPMPDRVVRKMNDFGNKSKSKDDGKMCNFKTELKKNMTGTS